MKQATLFIALLGAIFLVGCGGNGDTTSQTTFNNGSGDQPFKPVTHLSHRALVTNFYAGAMDVVDTTQNRLTSSSFSTGSEPTYMQPSPDGTLTFSYNSASYTITSLNNNLEAVKGTANLGGWTESFVTSSSNKFGFAAVYDFSNGAYSAAGAIARFNPTDGSLNTFIPFPHVRYLAMDNPPVEAHLLAFKDVAESTPADSTVAYQAYWVDLTTDDPATQLPEVALLTLQDPAGNTIHPLSRPVAAFFSSDSSTAYILNCAAECGGTGTPSVVAINNIRYTASTNTGFATVINQWNVNGARRGLIDLTAKKLYVVGSLTTSKANDCPFGSTTCTGGANNVQDGYFSAIDLTAAASTGTITPITPASLRIGNGAKRWIRPVNGNFWVASTNCGVQSCITIVNPSTPSASVLPQAKGDGTGIALAANSGQVYTIEGGELNIYDQSGNPISSEYITDIKGQAYDVIYID